MLADTDRFNEAMGLPVYALEETPQANGTVLRRGSGKAAGFTLEWEERPFEWIHGRHFRQSRVLQQGAVPPFGPTFDLAPEAGRQPADLHDGMGAADADRPPVRRPARAPGRRGDRKTHSPGGRLREG
ncbi:MAG: hypothetical protein WDN31_09090 [Hyphomicrobium sp.]